MMEQQRYGEFLKSEGVSQHFLNKSSRGNDSFYKNLKPTKGKTGKCQVFLKTEELLWENAATQAVFRHTLKRQNV